MKSDLCPFCGEVKRVYYPPYENRGETMGLLWCPNCKKAVDITNVGAISEISFAFDLPDGVYSYNSEICKKCFKSRDVEWQDDYDEEWLSDGFAMCPQIMQDDMTTIDYDDMMGIFKPVPKSCSYLIEHMMSRLKRKDWVTIAMEKREKHRRKKM